MDSTSASWCGKSAFWNDSLLESENPDLGECFRQTVCLWIPCIVPLTFGTARIARFLLAPKAEKLPKRRPLMRHKWFIIKTLLTLSVVVLTLLEDIDDVASLLFVAVSTASYLIMVLLEYVDYCQDNTTFTLQFYFWLLSWACYVPTVIIGGAVNYVIVTILILLWLLNCINEDFPKGNSELRATHASMLFHSWIETLLAKGYYYEGDPLKLEDLPKVNISIPGIISRFKGNYERNSFNLALIKTFLPEILLGGIWRLINDFLQCSAPILLRYFIISLTEEDTYAWKAYFWAVLLFATTVTQTTVFHYSHRVMLKVALGMKAAAISMVFEKTLRIPTFSPDLDEEKKKSTEAETATLISVDAQRFVEVMQTVHVLWTSPLQLIAGFMILHNMVGTEAASAGLAVLLVCIPLNFLAAHENKRLQDRQSKAKDERVKLLGETLHAIKTLKLNAWEELFFDKMNEAREKEIKCLKLGAVVWGTLNTILAICPALVTLAAFGTYIYVDPENNILTAEKMFSCMAIFNVIRIPMWYLPMTIMRSVTLSVSLRRMSEFLNRVEVNTSHILEEDKENGNIVDFRKVTSYWNTKGNDAFALRDIDLHCRKGSLVGILGRVGSGKTSLLATILGEMTNNSQREGLSIRAKGDIGYVPQQPWIQNMTLRANVIFGHGYDEDIYNKVLRASALNEDAQKLPAGDLTEIGENGVNLSGGQKQRVCLARAAYHTLKNDDSENNGGGLVLFDDPLSALDGRVAETVFNELIGPKGLLRKSTRIVVTHNLSFLPSFDNLVLLDKGAIIEQGSFSDLTSRTSHELLESSLSPPLAHETEQLKSKEGNSGLDVNNGCNDDKDRQGRITCEEEVEVGRVSFTHLVYFIRNMNYSAAILIVSGFVLAEAIHTGSTVVLTFWSADSRLQGGNVDHAYYLTVFGIMTAVHTFVDWTREYFMAVRFAEASRRIHRSVLSSVLASPLAFFDSNPSGRVVNRLIGDIQVVDSVLPRYLSGAQWTICLVMASIALICYNAPIILVGVVPIIICGIMIQIYYSRTNQQLKRIAAVNTSPIFSQFSECLQGSDVIRAFDQSERFKTEYSSLLGRHIRCEYVGYIANKWLGSRLEYLGNLIVLMTGLLSIYLRNSVNAEMAALLVTFAIMTVEWVGLSIFFWSEVEAESVALERLRQYEDLEKEEKHPDREHETDWLKEGSVSFQAVCSKYRADLDEVLTDMTWNLPPGGKLGVCGRTGAGKSSLAMAMLRVLQPSKGRITISDRDISRLSLRSLRSSVAIITQDPLLFSGTIRSNVDPSAKSDDEEIWRCLKEAHFTDLVDIEERGLDTKVMPKGENFSVGQRQLLCLARAILKRNKVLILDEATASMDIKTDRIIRETLQRSSALQGCTLIIIAHRLDTILDCDLILTMENGKMIEFDRPSALLDNPKSKFLEMCQNAGVKTIT